MVHSRFAQPELYRTILPKSLGKRGWGNFSQALSLTQEQFAARFGFSVATLRHWERGDRSPSGASLVLLNVIDHNPTAVMKALK